MPSSLRSSKRNDPVLRIRTLIQDLDAELMQICRHCSLQKRMKNSGSETRNNYIHQDRVNRLLKRVAGSTTLSTALSKPPAQNCRNRSYRTRVLDAYRDRRIFMVHGNFQTVRKALLQRGWLEKLPANRYADLQAMTDEDLLEQARRGNEYESALLSKMIHPYPAFFIWQGKAQPDLFPDAMPYRNRIRRSRLLDFSTKVGLMGCAQQETWQGENGVCRMNYPRFYCLDSDTNEDRTLFIDDYHNTQARSLLRWVKDHSPEELINPEHGAVMSSILDSALKRVQKQLKILKHDSLDPASGKNHSLAEVVENHTFVTQSLEVLKKGAKFKITERAMKEYARLAERYLDQIEALRPDFRWDGIRNLWILKPGYQSCGNGIVIRNSLDGVLDWIRNNPSRTYVIQKYIERPMLVYRTKFDIRQYMLLTIGEDKLTVWSYRDCYLRFSSKEFTMDDLRESIHLTNNSVQKRYKNESTRDIRLPRNNMWSLDQFKCHLHHIGAPVNTWEKIYKGFQQNFVAVVKASLDETKLIQNAFELYGCDFMLDEEYNPILIEINCSPDLTPTTDVTARICPLALKDCIRVVVDLPKDPTVSTGLFDRAFEMPFDANTKQVDSCKQPKINGDQEQIHDRTKSKPRKGSRPICSLFGNVRPAISNKLGRSKAQINWMKKIKKENCI